MGGYFLDTSALVKRYRVEAGTPIIDQLFTQSAPLVISRLGIVETVSALAMKVRIGELSTGDYDVARKKFIGDISGRSLSVSRIFASHFRAAERLVDHYGKSRRLRTLDALQLSMALDLMRLGKIDTVVCADSILCEIAALESLKTLNPR